MFNKDTFDPSNENNATIEYLASLNINWQLE
jgi:hypothetical protein